MSNVIDYFAVLGRKAGPLTPNLVEASVDVDTGRSIHVAASDQWHDAITDVSVIFDDEELPDETWESLEQTVNGDPLRRPHIVFRRRRYSNRLDHIVNVS